LGGVMTKLINRNTTVPTRKSETFSTAEDNQPAVEVHVLQGEREMAQDNKTLGRFKLEGIAPASRGVPQIVVTFDIDANGILHVTARDKATGKEQKVTITASSGLTKDEVEKMVKEAESHAQEDKTRRDEIEQRNTADSLIYQAEHTLTDLGDQIPADLRTEVEEKIKAARSAMNGTDMDAIRATAEELAQTTQRIGSEAQAGAAASDSTGEKSAEKGKDAETIEGEFHEV